MGILKVEIDFRDIACNIIATKNAAKNLIECCDKMQINLDLAVTKLNDKEVIKYD